MRYALAVLLIAWFVYLAVFFVASVVMGVDVRGPFEFIGDVLS